MTKKDKSELTIMTENETINKITKPTKPTKLKKEKDVSVESIKQPKTKKEKVEISEKAKVMEDIKEEVTVVKDDVNVNVIVTEEVKEEKPIQKKRGRRPNQKLETVPTEPVVNIKKKGKHPKESYGLNDEFEEDDPFFNQQEVENDCIETPIIRLNVTAADIRKIKDPNVNLDDGDNELNIPSAFNGTEDFSYFQSNNTNHTKDNNTTVTESDIQQLRTTREKEIENAEVASNDSKLLCQYIEHNKKGTWPEKSVYDCMWCRYPFENTPWAIPYRLTYDNKFEVFGNFCSPNCSAAYIFDRFDDDEMWDRYALLNMLYQKVYDLPGAIVKSAPDILFLKKLGGILTIEEYREISNNINKNYYVKMPPMVSIIPSVEELQQTSLFNDNSSREHLNKELMMKANEELRLRRNNPIYNESNTLENYFHIS
jgi:hypothetical protein